MCAVGAALSNSGPAVRRQGVDAATLTATFIPSTRWSAHDAHHHRL
jgi:hypothetical protein